jgi:putative (di)nucleoside polyphosphate hydrolase
VIDPEGYRANVGIVLVNAGGQVFLGKRIGQNAWQLPQGGMDEGESPEQAMYRELYEEVGLRPGHVEVVAQTADWLRYQIPEHLIRKRAFPRCIGQKQVWFLLRMLAADKEISLCQNDTVEFDDWQWVDYWKPAEHVIDFKKAVYQQALKELATYL